MYAPGFIKTIATNVCEAADNITGEIIHRQTAQDILDAVYNPKINFIKYIEDIIKGA